MSGPTPVHGFAFSDAERRRRWALVREQMDARGLGALVVSGFHSVFWEAQASLRWLADTDAEGFLLFPLEGEPVLLAFDPYPKRTRRPGCWVLDQRSGFPSFGEGLVALLRERRLGRGGLGLLSVAGVPGEYAGFPHATHAALEAALPDARLEDATAWFAPLRMRKSAEEVRVFEIGCEIGERIFDAVRETAAPGVSDAEVRAAILAARTRGGAETNSLLFYAQGKDVFHGLDEGLIAQPGYADPLQPGDVIVTEICTRVLGYEIEFNQPFALGEPDAEWERIFATAAASFRAGVEALRPGIDAADLQAAMRAPLDAAGFTWRFPFFHGAGLLDEAPFSTVRLSNATDGREVVRPQPPLPLEAGMVLEFEPHVVTVDRWDSDPAKPPIPRRGATLGAPVLVTEDGCRVLGGREPAVIRIPG